MQFLGIKTKVISTTLKNREKIKQMGKFCWQGKTSYWFVTKLI
jgi:hypothetical protein